MGFTAEDFGALRRRLGWSQADMGRRLGCYLQQIEHWESGTEPIPVDLHDELEYLRHQCGHLAEVVTLQAMAEATLAKTSRTQVHRDEVDPIGNQDDIA